jgi:hypothetical protein
MAKLSWFRKIYWRNFAQPSQERALFRHLLEHPISSVLEIGIGNGERMKHILQLYSLKSGASQLRYAAVDLFESAPLSDGHLKLKDVHRLLAESQVKAHLIPGEVVHALPRVGQNVMPSDLIIIDEGWGEASPQGEALRSWLPRLAHETTHLFGRGCRTQPLNPIAIAAATTATRLAA